MSSRILLTLIVSAGVAVVQPVAPTPAIKVDQIGYPARGPKVAMVSGANATEFLLRDAASDAVVHRGTLSAAATDADSGDHVRQADFSAVSKAGRLVLDVPGVGRSWPFAIGDNVHAATFTLAARAFYGQRCGTAVDLGPAFPGYKYAACHLDQRFHPSSGGSGARRVARGWHDAGDYGRYVVNSGISTATLLWAYELYEPRVKGVRLDIPESANAVPDLLDEIRWNLDWMLSMQRQDGGVWHKQTTAAFSGFVMPEADKAPSEVIGTGSAPFASTCATANLAAVSAIAARVFRPFDATYAGEALAAARTAWQWAEKHPDVPFRNPSGVSTGEYGDRDCGDERLWASAELWRTTKEPAFEAAFLAAQAKYRATLRPAGPPSWSDVAPFAFWTYVLGGGRAAIAADVRREILAAADAVATRTAAHPYRIAMTTSDYIWGSNGVAANYGVQLLVARAIDPQPRYRDAALDQLHYLLGRNTFSLSWVTQAGANPYRHPHHRPSGADANREPWPGLLSGGPNARRQDPAMQKMEARPPARMFLDDQESYASNEIAINWNAPLVFLLAGLLE